MSVRTRTVASILIGVLIGLALGLAVAAQSNGAPESGRNDYIAGGTTAHFTPSDTTPEGVPAGTVCYEVFDVAAGVRYWVFRWPNTTADGEAQWSVVPRVTTDKNGALVAYEPPTYGSDAE